MYCKANFKSVAKCKKRLCTAVFALFKKNTRRVAWPVLQSRCKALSALSQNTLKNTKTGRKSVGFLILTQAPKCTRSHCFPPQKHPKNGFVMRFAGKNSFFQLRARDFSFYMNAYSSDIGSRASIAQPPRPLDSSESAARVDVIRTFLETPENEPYTLLPDGRYLFRIAPTPMRGLGLPSEALEQVYGGNARMFLGRARPVDAAKAASLAHSFAAGVEALHARELFLAADAAPLRQKAVQLQALAE